MKKITLFIFLLIGFGGFSQITTSPSPALAEGPVTLTFNKTGTGLASYTGTIYAHIGVTVDGTQWSFVKGSWGNNTTQPSLTSIGGNSYTLQLTPNLYSYFGIPTTSTISQICVVFRAASGSPQTQDYFINVGAFQVNLTTPAEGSTTILNAGANLNITANNTGGNAKYELFANNTLINTNNSTSNYSFNHTNITQNQNYRLVVTNGGDVKTKNFTAIVNPVTVTEPMPAGARDGITYHDATSATLVLNAPGKDFVYVAGSFDNNNWQPGNAHAMKKDGTTGKFWLTLTGLNPGQVYTYQYWVVDQTPVANSPALVKTADPFSTLVLSPYDDPYITTYPNMPQYPEGQNFEVSVLQTNQQPYNWQVTDFERPAKEDLIIYELLIRDFDSNKTWQGLIDRIDYFKNLNVNAIELMPVMEFEGNISWGYNTAFHMAIDKSYGNANSMKQFIDLCHQNGIAVILDLAINHVYGRSPLARMWVNDPDGDGFGSTTAENPYCNVTPAHSYNVGTDLNHQSPLTQYYTERTMEYWMTEFNIDGFRWDLTKGFTQNCTNNETCTNNYQADRVAILKQYADYQWAIDPDFYVIFEHLGVGSGANSSAAEETEWANYRVNEGKGIMFWGKLNSEYNQLTMGYSSGSNFGSMNYETRGFQQPRLVGYAESHDEERLMYKNLLYGNNVSGYNITSLPVALKRMEALGAVVFTIPGPKMFWQFGELGFDFGINRCENNTYNNDCRTSPKPIPFELGYDTNPERMSVYDAWSKIIDLRVNNEVFHTTTFTISSGNLLPRIDIWNTSLPATQLNSVIVLANFTTAPQNVNTFFPTAGTWYNLMDNSTISGSTSTVNLQPGEFRIFGNQQASLGSQNFVESKASLYPNPAATEFAVSIPVSKVEMYNIAGQLVKSFGAAQAGQFYNVASLSEGLYLVKITDIENRQSTVKFIKK
jgi:pullulanase/glycogen debranching enzyme